MSQSTVVFTINPGSSDEQSATVNGPASPTSTDLLPEWVTDQTADLTRVTYRTVDNEVWQWRFTLRDVTTSQKNSLTTFYRTYAEGPTNTFQYTHTDGTNYTARFIETPRFRRNNDNNWDVDLSLEIDGPLNS